MLRSAKIGDTFCYTLRCLRKWYTRGVIILGVQVFYLPVFREDYMHTELGT